MSSLIPYKDAGVDASPFVVVFEKIGIPFAADIMNFVVLTAILSAANSGLYASTRMLWSLANEGVIPARVARTKTWLVEAAQRQREAPWQILIERRDAQTLR